MATLDQVIGQMIAADMPPLPPGHPIADGRFRRYGPKNKAWYKLFEFLARNGRRYIVGSFGRWAGNDPGAFKVEQSFEGMHADEVERFRRSQAELEAKAEAARRDKAERAANRAKQQYEAARASGSSPYLERKGFAPAEKGALPAGLRVFADGTLAVPMIRYDVTEEQLADVEYKGPRKLCGLQKIAPDGSKLFNKGMAKEGCAFRLGAKPKDGEPILICEGARDRALDPRMATGRRAACSSRSTPATSSRREDPAQALSAVAVPVLRRRRCVPRGAAEQAPAGRVRRRMRSSRSRTGARRQGSPR
jgi:putative DNA primase/helicase